MLPYYTIYAHKIPYNNADKKSDGYASNCKFFSTVLKRVFTKPKKYAIIEARIMKGVHFMDFERLNRETFNYNNGISRNLDPTRGATETYSQKFARLNLETYRYNNYKGR